MQSRGWRILQACVALAGIRSALSLSQGIPFALTRNPAVSTETAAHRIDRAWKNMDWKDVDWHGRWTTFNVTTGNILDDHVSIRAFKAMEGGSKISHENTHFESPGLGERKMGPWYITKEQNFGPRGMFYPIAPENVVVPLPTHDVVWGPGDCDQVEGRMGVEMVTRPGKDMRTSIGWIFERQEEGGQLYRISMIREQANQPWPETMMEQEAKIAQRSHESVRSLLRRISLPGKGERTDVDLQETTFEEVHCDQVMKELQRDDTMVLELPDNFFAVYPKCVPRGREFSIGALRKAEDAVATWEVRYSPEKELQWFQRTDFALS